MEKLTKQQQKLLKFIEEQIEASGDSPSYREIAKHFNFSSLGTVWRHIQTLKKKGALQHSRYGVRQLEPLTGTHGAYPIVNIPFIGTVKAGFPLETFARIEERSIPWQWPTYPPENGYLIQVKDNSFKEEMIIAGDLLLIAPGSSISPGQMTLIIANHRESLIKRVWQEEEFVRLEASDASVRSMILRSETIEIQGILLALFRNW